MMLLNMSIPRLLWLTLLAAGARSEQTCSCPPSSFSLPHGCCHLVADGTFEAVQVACRSLGGRLAVPSNASLDTAFGAALLHARRGEAWIGFRAKQGAPGDGATIQKGSWLDGSTFNYSNWDEEPGKGACAVLSLYTGWRRRLCDLTAPGLCLVSSDAVRPCARPAPPPLHQLVRQILGGYRLSEAAKTAQMVLPAPPLPLPPPPEVPWHKYRPVQSGRLIMRDAPITWYRWL